MTPDSWDDVRIGGAKLKAKGHPVGISLGWTTTPSSANNLVANSGIVISGSASTQPISIAK